MPFFNLLGGRFADADGGLSHGAAPAAGAPEELSRAMEAGRAAEEAGTAARAEDLVAE